MSGTEVLLLGTPESWRESLAGVGLRQRSLGPGLGLVRFGVVCLAGSGRVWQFCWVGLNCRLPEMHKHGTSHWPDGVFRAVVTLFCSSWTSAKRSAIDRPRRARPSDELHTPELLFCARWSR